MRKGLGDPAKPPGNPEQGMRGYKERLRTNRIACGLRALPWAPEHVGTLCLGRGLIQVPAAKYPCPGPGREQRAFSTPVLSNSFLFIPSKE